MKPRPVATMLGIDGAAVQAAAAAARARIAQEAEASKSVPVLAAPPDAVEEPAQEAPQDPAIEAQRPSIPAGSLPFNTTRIEGELSPEAIAAVIAAEESARQAGNPVQLASSSTSLGLGHVPKPAPPATSGNATAIGLGTPAAPPPVLPKAAVGSTTTLGMASPPAPPVAAAPPPSKGMHGRTMLGVPLASMPPFPAASATPAEARLGTATVVHDASPPSTTDDSQEDDADSPAHYPNLRAAKSGGSSAVTVPPGASSAAPNSRALIAGVLGGLALFALAAMIYVRFSAHAHGADVRAQIVTQSAVGNTLPGESLQFTVPSAVEGSHLRFGGQQQPLVAGRATFPLASDSLRVGDNVVLVDVIDPSGESASARIVLSVAYRLWVDTAGLRAARPSIEVKANALPKTRITLEGEALTLDAKGHGSKTFPVDTSRALKGGVIDHVVHYEVQPASGDPLVDQLHTRIPVAALQIDRPSTDLVTDSDTVEIAGGVGRDTEVSIDGKQVLVKEGRFLQRLALPKPGDYKPRVTASAEGKAPFSLTLNIRRVRDLAQAAREFSYDKTLTYAKIAGEPNNFRGQPIAIEGRIYAVDARSGSSVIQMLARPCPGSQRCSLWVVDPQASDVAVDRWVRVLGTVEGEQQFRSESNQIVTVPKVVARFILPAKP